MKKWFKITTLLSILGLTSTVLLSCGKNQEKINPDPQKEIRVYEANVKDIFFTPKFKINKKIVKIPGISGQKIFTLASEIGITKYYWHRPVNMPYFQFDIYSSIIKSIAWHHEIFHDKDSLRWSELDKEIYENFFGIPKTPIKLKLKLMNKEINFSINPSINPIYKNDPEHYYRNDLVSISCKGNGVKDFSKYLQNNFSFVKWKKPFDWIEIKYYHLIMDKAHTWMEKFLFSAFKGEYINLDDENSEATKGALYYFHNFENLQHYKIKDNFLKSYHKPDDSEIIEAIKYQDYKNININYLTLKSFI